MSLCLPTKWMNEILNIWGTSICRHSMFEWHCPPGGCLCQCLLPTQTTRLLKAESYNYSTFIWEGGAQGAGRAWPYSLHRYFPDPWPSDFRLRWIPFFERRTSWGILIGSLEGSRENSKRSKQRAVTTFISFMANCCPMQFLQWVVQRGTGLWGVQSDEFQFS